MVQTTVIILIIKKLADESKKQFTCSGESTEHT